MKNKDYLTIDFIYLEEKNPDFICIQTFSVRKEHVIGLSNHAVELQKGNNQSEVSHFIDVLTTIGDSSFMVEDKESIPIIKSFILDKIHE